MRVDKFLKESRIIKRRSVAKQACDTGRVLRDDRKMKAGDNVDIGDIITVVFGDRSISFEVMELIENPRKADAERMYRVVVD